MTENGQINLMIVEDDADDLKEFVKVMGAEPKIRIVGTASTVNDVIEQVQTQECDVALVDMRIPYEQDDKPEYKYGLEALKTISQMQPQTRILAITSLHQEYSLVFKSMQAGAHGYILKRGSHDDMIKSIFKVHHGDYVINADIANLVLQTMKNPLSLFGDMPTSIDRTELRPRELEVLKLMRDGIVDNDELVERLGITPRAVSNLVSSILLKLQMRSRYALQHEIYMDRIRSEGMYNLDQIGDIIRIAATSPREHGFDIGCWTKEALTEILIDEDIIPRSPFT